jgi:hypothetical protein
MHANTARELTAESKNSFLKHCYERIRTNASTGDHTILVYVPKHLKDQYLQQTIEELSANEYAVAVLKGGDELVISWA